MTASELNEEYKTKEEYDKKIPTTSKTRRG